MSEHSCWKFLLDTWAISLMVHKYGFVLLNRLRIKINTVFSNPRTAKLLKNEQKWVSLKRPLQVHCYIPIYSIDCTQNQIPKSCPAHKRKNLVFILNGLEVITQTWLKLPITL